MRRTKIVCTIGPAINSPEKITEMIEAGMDVARLNLSHGLREDHLRSLDMIRGVGKNLKKNVGILFDTRGPEVRTGTLEREFIILEDGQKYIITTDDIIGNQEKVSVTYQDLHLDLKEGSVILIDDGLIELEVENITEKNINCRVIHGGELRSYKGLNTPGSRINLPAVGVEDAIDIQAAIEHEVEFLAASFTRSAEDIHEIRHLVEKQSGSIMILAKIESREGVDNYDSILDVCDGVMVARGDLGVEIPPEEVPLLQKQFIRKCNHRGKPVITATQMLDSMIRNPRPTRAEASDVANAIFDGTDAVMLSGETAIGRYPVESVKTMSRIAIRTEAGLSYKRIMEDMSLQFKKTVTDAISYATSHIAFELSADAIITATQSGHTARMVSKYKPRAPIIAVSSRQRIASQLTLTWGVQAIVCPPVNSTDDMFNNATRAALREGLISEGNLVVITAGVPVGVSGTTNLLRVETIGEVIARGTGIGRVAVSGPALLIKDENDLNKVRGGEIIIADNTDSGYTGSIEKAAGLITGEGGLTSNGAIIAINLNKPAVVGVENALKLVENGEIITIDSIRGLIYRGEANVL